MQFSESLRVAYDVYSVFLYLLFAVLCSGSFLFAKIQFILKKKSPRIPTSSILSCKISFIQSFFLVRIVVCIFKNFISVKRTYFSTKLYLFQKMIHFCLLTKAVDFVVIKIPVRDRYCQVVSWAPRHPTCERLEIL